jgi:hypothetical protein
MGNIQSKTAALEPVNDRGSALRGSRPNRGAGGLSVARRAGPQPVASGIAALFRPRALCCLKPLPRGPRADFLNGYPVPAILRSGRNRSSAP